MIWDQGRGVEPGTLSRTQISSESNRFEKQKGAFRRRGRFRGRAPVAREEV